MFQGIPCSLSGVKILVRAVIAELTDPFPQQTSLFGHLLLSIFSKVEAKKVENLCDSSGGLQTEERMQTSSQEHVWSEISRAVYNHQLILMHTERLLSSNLVKSESQLSGCDSSDPRISQIDTALVL